MRKARTMKHALFAKNDTNVKEIQFNIFSHSNAHINQAPLTLTLTVSSSVWPRASATVRVNSYSPGCVMPDTSRRPFSCGAVFRRTPPVCFQPYSTTATSSTDRLPSSVTQQSGSCTTTSSPAFAVGGRSSAV